MNSLQLGIVRIQTRFSWPPTCLRAVFLFFVAIAIAARSSPAQSFTTIDFGGATSTGLSGINNAGQIVGQWCDPISCHSIRWVGGQPTTMDPSTASGGVTNAARGINNVGQVGQIVGSYEASPGTDGYFWNGSFTSIDLPGSIHGFNSGTTLNGINDKGQIVGWASGAGNGGFLLSSPGTAHTIINAPDGTPTTPNGINNAGLIVGQYQSGGFLYDSNTGSFTPLSAFYNASGINNLGVIVGTDGTNGLIKAGNNYTAFQYPNAVRTSAYGINDLGQIVGTYVDSQSITHGFLASPVTLVDPVPSLLMGPTVTTDQNLLSSLGSTVQGVASDGVTQVVIRIPAGNVNDQITVTLVNDQGLSGQSILPNEDGAVGKPGDTSFSQGQTTVRAQNTSGGPMAFAIYRAPLDFSRTTPAGSKLGVCNRVTDIDDNLACRSVSVQVQDVTAASPPMIVPITIVRPPVVLIHGLWSAPDETWNNFSPLYSPGAGDPRFHIDLVDYSYPVGDRIVASNPPYSASAIAGKARANSLGFQFNASFVLQEIELAVIGIKLGKNPLGIPVAAVQADVVGHSMGGDITRTLPLQALYLGDPNFGQGSVHKLITVDTPHLGSPLATEMLDPRNSCVSWLFSKFGFFSFDTVYLMGGATTSGAISDLQGDGTGASMSPALGRIANPGSHALPTALIAGVATSVNYAGLSNTNGIRIFCGDFTVHNPLASLLTPTGWPSAFGDNDGVVPLPSETVNMTPYTLFSGYIHSPGIAKLGFSPPTIVDAGPVPTRVIQLLNTPVTQPDFILLNP